MKKRVIFLLLIFVFITGCNDNNTLRSPNGTLLISKTYQLALEDTNKIITQENNVFKIKEFEDSLHTRTDTIWYKEPESTKYEKVFGKIDQIVINSRNREVKELYKIESGKTYLVGYITTDTTKPYTKFNPPVIIYPEKDTKEEINISKMQTISGEGVEIGNGVKVKTELRLGKTGAIEINGSKEEFYLYELTIKQDAVIQYGDQGLIVPEAIELSSKMLIGIKSGLIAEWGIRLKQKEEERETLREEARKESERYLEINIYQQVTKKEKSK